MYCAAVEPLGLSVKPRQQRPRVSLLPGGRQCGEVVDVEMVAPGKVFSDAEASHGECGRGIAGYGTDQTVTAAPLSLVHLPHEFVLGSKFGPQLPHRVEGAAGVWREQLDDHDGPSCQHVLHRPQLPQTGDSATAESHRTLQSPALCRHE